ncbi:MAG: hypothetical protein EOS29_32735, partial [Mesorhizobium sp.]|uniref:hypothetical protein n=1 Tax=Mesorhizobium sp. TaxID=1871066 RepID=UPI000FE73620
TVSASADEVSDSAASDAEADENVPVGVAEASETVEASDEGQGTSDEGPGKKRRRGKRGGKRNRREDGEDEAEA